MVCGSQAWRKGLALDILRAHPIGPASKYEGRLELELDRSWRKSEEWTSRAEARPRPDYHATTPLEPTEDLVARQFTKRLRDTARYDHDAGCWYFWNGERWQSDQTQTALFACREIARELSAPVGQRVRLNAGRHGFAAGAERLARTEPAHVIRQRDWDPDPYLLGVPGGVVDLRNGTLREPSSSQFITRHTKVAPENRANCPRWTSFLDEATGGDVDFVGYLQRMVGYALTGHTAEQVLGFIHGPGGNGKSVFVNTVTEMVGDYAATAPMDAFSSSQGDRHPTDLAMLCGARLVTASETEEGRAWAESRIKQLTGGDPISAQFMRQDFFTYRPQFKLLIVGNHKPIIRRVDAALRRRFHMIPFVQQPTCLDLALASKLDRRTAGHSALGN